MPLGAVHVRAMIIGDIAVDQLISLADLLFDFGLTKVFSVLPKLF